MSDKFGFKNLIMELNLSERLLRFKENSYSETFLADYSGINVIESSSAEQEKKLDGTLLALT